MEQEIKSLFYDLGMVVYLKGKSVSSTHTTLHFDVDSIKDLSQIDKNVKLISKFLHKEVTVKKSNNAHFAISIPNEKKSLVSFYDKKYDKLFGNELTVFAGVDEEDKPICLNLEEMPHILVSGTTGSGKSVMMNNIICGLLRQDKYQIHFSMIDTKRVELAPYRKLTCLYCDVATDSQSATELLYNICLTLEERYELMEKHGWRKIPSYYHKIIVVIEELGDLILSNSAVERHIVKIAQLGRACGIHLIIATQRPTVDIVTGEIKANIGCRFALQTTSGIDSRNILGHNGAEKLKGNGDCLLKLPTLSDEIHLQCPYISDADIEKTIKKFMEEN